MPWWGWLLVGVGVVVAAGAAGLVVFFVHAAGKAKRWRAEVLADGEDTAAWVVHVEKPEGLMWPIVLVLLCPDPDVPDEVMRGLAERVRAVRKRKPTDPDEKKVAKNTRTQADSPGRYRLPDGFTDGWEVYSQYFDLWEEDEENLPGDGVGGESFPVRLVWEGEPGPLGTLVVPPLKKGKKRRS